MRRLRQNNAFAFTFALIFLAMIIAFLTVFVFAVVNGISEANRLDESKKAYYTAEAGLADAYERIVNAGFATFASSTCSNSNIPSTCTTPFVPSSTTDNGVYAVGSVNGSYTVSLVYSGSPRTNYVITSQGTYGNVTRTLQLKMIAASFSRYAYWSQTEVNPQLGKLWWISGMLTTGPVQTNGSFNIFGNPVFNGAVAEVGSSPDYYYGTGTDPTSSTKSDPSYIFPDGLTNNAPAINLPPTSTLANFKTGATNGGLTLTGASTVTFNSNGTINVTGKVVNSSCQTTANYNNTTMNIPASGVVYVQSTKTISACKSSSSDGNVTVQGTVNGQLTVAADQNVYISGNVQYNSNPTTNPSSTDMVGLVAYNNVTVIEADAPAQLAVQGVIVALGGSFDVDQYSKNPDPTGNSSAPDGANMYQFGSLVNYASGCTGIVNSSGQLIDGWNQIQSYDTRLATLAPPSFPPLVNSAGQGVYVKLSITECFSGTCG
ncbi:MAG: DUF4900 domain-containing protein [Candidatus Omnitrophica bacterium]|nr:DUF4900 domain-containing protein [Candidatus Omnitrophota bacterium]MDE2009298.1 DUF4900 domain-containing protein [Candidatus Omnitrophota bacterium]MDE2213817.1 DUF4900 domain-containing protein [Candidatus Omnitrophota bacterium]MDE2232327.1 DUF4900 domain-containing protein [Candidatus Omnitrophota bacterium]